MEKQSAVLLNPASILGRKYVGRASTWGKHSGRGPEPVESHVGRGSKPSSI